MLNLDQSSFVGYEWLIRHFNLPSLGHWHLSQIGGTRRIERSHGEVLETYPQSYQPNDSLEGHLEFALKYDGVNLEILAHLFEQVTKDQVASIVRNKPTGKYARRIWYLYEFLTGNILPIDDLRVGNYLNLLEEEQYYTSVPQRVPRQRINDNLLGTRDFCPIVRRTTMLSKMERLDFRKRCQQLAAGHTQRLWNRALQYAYTRETKSSFEIEHERPNASRTERFIALLKLADRQDFLSKAALVELQNQIVDPRFKELSFRDSQNYVGETISWDYERIHFVPPKPEALEQLMQGLFVAHRRMASQVHPVVHAAAVSFGFVFLHPFVDGNGRIHRFLIHNVLSQRGLTPEGMIFPVSAAILQDIRAYDQALEQFSQPLLRLLEYDLNESGEMTVKTGIAHYYRYLDLTIQTEALFHFIEATVDSILPQELEFLAKYDQAKQQLREIVDLPDRLSERFIKFCLQNNGRLSNNKRGKFFTQLTDEEIQRMEHVIAECYQDIEDVGPPLR